MKLIESSDGTITILELDPTKSHIVMLDPNSPVCTFVLDAIQKEGLRDGLVLPRLPMTILENVERVEAEVKEVSSVEAQP